MGILVNHWAQSTTFLWGMFMKRQSHPKTLYKKEESSNHFHIVDYILYFMNIYFRISAKPLFIKVIFSSFFVIFIFIVLRKQINIIFLMLVFIILIILLLILRLLFISLRNISRMDESNYNARLFKDRKR